MCRSYSTHVKMRNVHKNLDRKPGRMRPLGRHLCRWILKISFCRVWAGFVVSECKVMMGMCEYSNER
jgi:hypothetical protein